MSKRPITLTFQSRLAASREEVWEWITSVEGIAAEMQPLLKMVVPKHITSLGDLRITPGRPLFRSWLFLFGFIPIGFSDLTLLEVKNGIGFLEASPILGMRQWRHERWITEVLADPSKCVLNDRLTFESLVANRLVAWFVRKLFEHRHFVLRKRIGCDRRDQ